jgi:hypothetical protein
LSVTVIGTGRDVLGKSKELKVSTMHSLKQIIAGALLAAGVLATGLGAGTGQPSAVYGSGGCPVGHYCALLGR